MTEKAILVIGYKRPRYLYITLQGVFRVRGIEDYDVFVSIDGNEETKEAKEVISQFDIKKSIFRSARLNNLLHVTHSLKTIFDTGYNLILYIENDFLLRPDTIEYVRKAKKDCFFLSLQKIQPDRKIRRQNRIKAGIDLDFRDGQIIRAYREGKSKDEVQQEFGSSDIKKRYSPLGNVILARDFEKLFNFVVRLEYLGERRAVKGGDILNNVWIGHGNAFNRFLIDKQHCSRYADQPYVYHFGVRGWHQIESSYVTEVEQKIFSGPRERWVDNVIEIANRSSQRFLTGKALIPKEFKYD